jgi:hypothetical protein
LVAEGSAKAAFASHVLEHLSLNDARITLRHTYRMLQPGGVFRVIVPDLRSRAEWYVRQAAAGNPEASAAFMRSTLLGMEQRPRGLMRTIRQAFGNTSHLWMWDVVALRSELERCGFERIRECKFGDADDPAFAEIEDPERFIDVDLQASECALEAWKPLTGTRRNS